MKNIKILILALLFIVFNSNVNAQSLNTARRWYIYGQYSKALPVFKKELKTKPNDSSINFWYGVCLLKTGRQDESLYYLLKSKKRNIIDADLYLAEYYYIKKDPYNSLKEIKIYKNKRLTSSKRVKINNLEKKVNEYIKTKFKVEDIVIIDSIIVNKKDMYKEIKLSPSAGQLVNIKDFFKNKNKIESYAYLSERKDRIYFADSMSEKNNKKNLDLFLSYKILDKWKEITPLSKTINSPENEINPYILQDGVTIYFASKKDTSLNKYNLYISRYNPETKNYYIPQKLNAPFNSPENDYFLILDENKNRGYFASDRNNKEDSVTIYTFIPNEKIKLVKTDDIDKLMSRALIKSIKDTWKNKNLDSLLNTSKGPKIEKTIDKKDEKEIFIINDKIQYTKESQFKSKIAKEYFKTYQTLRIQLEQKRKEIKEKRLSYSSANKEAKEALGNKILELEQSISNLEKKIPNLELKIRNEENLEINK